MPRAPTQASSPAWTRVTIAALLAVRADGSEVRVICTPYDRRRGGQQGYDAIPRPNQSPDATKCWFHSSMLMPSDAFTGSYIAVFRKPYAPTALAYADGTLRWAVTLRSGSSNLAMPAFLIILSKAWWGMRGAIPALHFILI